MKKLSIYLTSFLAVLVLSACMGDRNDEVENVEENAAESESLSLIGAFSFFQNIIELQLFF